MKERFKWEKNLVLPFLWFQLSGDPRDEITVLSNWQSTFLFKGDALFLKVMKIGYQTLQNNMDIWNSMYKFLILKVINFKDDLHILNSLFLKNVNYSIVIRQLSFMSSLLRLILFWTKNRKN